MADFTVGKPVVATTGRKIETVDTLELEGSYDAGVEKITNGDFNGNADGWTLNDSGSYSGGKVTVLYASSDDPLISQPVTLESGKVYLLSFTISGSNDGVVVYFTTNSAESPALLGDGIKNFVFTANQDGSDDLFIDTVDYENGNTWTIDDVSCKELTDVRDALVLSDAFGRQVLALGGEYAGNLAIGVNSLENNIGERNIALGDGAGREITSGERNIAIGVDVNVPSPTVNDQVAIGTRIRANGDGVRFDGSTPTTILLPATPTAAQIATALDLLGLVELS
jgi:hypothetical protein